MDQPTTSTLAPPRVVTGEAMLIFGLSQRYHCANKAGIPSQWGASCLTWERSAWHTASSTTATQATSNISAASRCKSSLRAPLSSHLRNRRDLEADLGRGPTGVGPQAADGPLLERYGPEFDGHSGFGGLEIWIPIRS